MPDLVPSVPRPVVANEITTPKRTSQGRTYALEALRAFAILAMVLSGQLPFDQNSLPARMYHAQEPSLTHGVDLTLPVTTRVDLDFPFLLYSIGPAFPLALTQGTEQGISKVTCSILERGFLLGIFGLYVQTVRPGWKGLRLRSKIVGTEDGLAKYPYIRESRRIRAEFTILEQHVATLARMLETGLNREQVTAAPFKDSVGIGSYRIDVHATSSGDAGVYLSTVPFQIPLGALIPQRMENLLPACKNLGVTHITNGCYRSHPVEWNIGESAGMLVAFCLKQHRMPREVRNSDEHLSDFQKMLGNDGMPIEWPKGKVWPI